MAKLIREFRLPETLRGILKDNAPLVEIKKAAQKTALWNYQLGGTITGYDLQEGPRGYTLVLHLSGFFNPIRIDQFGQISIHRKAIACFRDLKAIHESPINKKSMSHV